MVFWWQHLLERKVSKGLPACGHVSVISVKLWDTGLESDDCGTIAQCQLMGNQVNIKYSLIWKCFYCLNPTWSSPVIQLISLSLGDRVGEAFHNKCHLSLYFQSFIFLTHNCFLIWVGSGSEKVAFLLYFFLPSFGFSLTAQKPLLRSILCDRHFASYLGNHSHTQHASICKHTDMHTHFLSKLNSKSCALM